MTSQRPAPFLEADRAEDRAIARYNHQSGRFTRPRKALAAGIAVSAVALAGWAGYEARQPATSVMLVERSAVSGTSLPVATLTASPVVDPTAAPTTSAAPPASPPASGSGDNSTMSSPTRPVTAATPVAPVSTVPVTMPSPTYVRKQLAAWTGTAGKPEAISASFVAPDQGNGGAWSILVVRWSVASTTSAAPGWGITLVDETTGQRYGIGGGGTGKGSVTTGGMPTGHSYHLAVGGDGAVAVTVSVDG